MHSEGIILPATRVQLSISGVNEIAASYSPCKSPAGKLESVYLCKMEKKPVDV